MRTILVVLAPIVPLLFAGCSTQQAYDMGQAWKRNECFRINDTQERNRCMASTSTSYEEYQRESKAARNPK